MLAEQFLVLYLRNRTPVVDVLLVMLHFSDSDCWHRQRIRCANVFLSAPSDDVSNSFQRRVNNETRALLLAQTDKIGLQPCAAQCSTVVDTLV